MTFREQVRWSGKTGLMLLLLAGPIIGWFAMTGERNPDLVLLTVGLLAAAALAGSIILLAFGVMIRSAHRWMYFRMSASMLPYGGGTVRERFSEGFDAPLWRWWLHIDARGKDRDA